MRRAVGAGVIGPKEPYRFPWRDGNRFRLLVDGDEIYPAMLEAVRQGRETVALEMYLFESGVVADRFIDALNDAARSGVTVRVLVDGFGAYRLNRPDRQRLAAGGVQLAEYNPLRARKLYRNLHRDHRKLLVVDGKRAFVGGVGITDMFDPRAGHGHHWHDVVVQISGPCVADWQSLFAANWQRWSGRPQAMTPPPPAAGAGTQQGRVTLARSWHHTEIKRSYLSHTRKARQRVWLATAYFVPSRKLRRALQRAAQAGVDVRLLLPGRHTDHPAVRHAGRRFYTRLLRHGVRIFEYQPRFLHAKAMLCDDWASVGSSNADRWNLRWNLEANQEVADRVFAEQLAAMMAADFPACREISFREWQRRPWYLRFAERFWGGVDRWLERRPQPRSWDR